MTITREGFSEMFQYGLHAINFLKDFFEKAPKEVKDKLPLFLGLSLEDERRWGRLWTKLDEPQRKILTNFLMDHCKDYERNSFRYTVVGITPDEDKITSGSGEKAKTTTSIKEDNAAVFLKIMAATIQTYGADETYRQCVVGGVINPDPFFRKVIAKWKEQNKWFETKVFSYLGIKKWEELSFEKLDTTTAAKLRAARLARKNPQVAREKVEIAGPLEIVSFGFTKKISARGTRIRNAGRSWLNPRNWFSKNI